MMNTERLLKHAVQERLAITICINKVGIQTTIIYYTQCSRKFSSGEFFLPFYFVPTLLSRAKFYLVNFYPVLPNCYYDNEVHTFLIFF